jgi:signal transduction histidine kinase
VQLAVAAPRRWLALQAMAVAGVSRPGRGRFAIATLLVVVWLARLVTGMAEVPLAAVNDTPIGPLHQFAAPIVHATMGIAGAWVLRGRSPGAGWILLLLSLQVLQQPLYALPGAWNSPGSWFFAQGHQAALATIAALYATDPARRLRPWVTPLAMALVAWYWLGNVGEMSQLTLEAPFRIEPSPWWEPLAQPPRWGWIAPLLILLGLAGDGRVIAGRFRAWLQPGGATVPLTRTQRRWFTAGVALAVGLEALAVVATARYLLMGGDGAPFFSALVEGPAGWGLGATILVLVALLLRHRLRAIAWLLLLGSSYIAFSITSMFATSLYPAEPSIPEIVVPQGMLALAVGGFTLVGTLYASEPGRRLGSWVLPVGMALAGWGAVAIALLPVWFALDLFASPPWWVSVMRAPLEWWNVTLFGPVLLGIAGDLQGPLRQSRERILRERTAPAGWPAIVADELMPGRETGRRSAAEAERVRLAADLHAEILPSLNMVLAESAAGASPEVIADRLRELERDVRGIVAERRLVILEELGIVEALEWLAERAEDRGPVAVGLTVQQAPTDGRPPREVERAAFRVAQLALDNALLHAAPGEIAIQVQAEPRRLRLQVEDDGGGLAPGSQERAARENRHGLADMRLQADLVHAHLDVRSERPGGTVVLFDWTGP